MRLQRRTPTAAVTGPAAWDNGPDAVETPSRVPPLARGDRGRRAPVWHGLHAAVITPQPAAEPPRGNHVQSHYAAAQVRPASFRPHMPTQVTEDRGDEPEPSGRSLGRAGHLADGPVFG